MKAALLSAISLSAVLVAATPFRGALHARQGLPDIPPECQTQCAPVAACNDATCACTPEFTAAATTCLNCAVQNGFLDQATADQILQGNADQCAAATGGTITDTATDTSVPTDTATDTVTPTETETTTTTPTTTPATPTTTPRTTTTAPPTTTRTTTSNTGAATQTTTTNSDNGARPTGVVGGVIGAGVLGAVAALVVL